MTRFAVYADQYGDGTLLERVGPPRDAIGPFAAAEDAVRTHPENVGSSDRGLLVVEINALHQFSVAVAKTVSVSE